jgi:hypothetical protein
MNTTGLSEQVSELRWLVYELGKEMETLVTTPYPHVHRFLMHSLTRKIAQVAESACSSLTEPVTNPVDCTPPVLAEHRREQASSQKGQ